MKDSLKPPVLTFEVEILRTRLEWAESWKALSLEIPSLTFPQGYEVKIIPPFAGAVARFYVGKPGTAKWVSVYLDWFDRLGCVGQPYWELYPNQEGDTERFLLQETAELMLRVKAAVGALNA
jgi:hypothetical protein